MSANGIPLDSAGIISTVLEGILYGFSVLMFGTTLWVLFYRRSTKHLNKSMLVVASLFFIFSTIHIIVDVIRIEDGLVKFRDTFPGGPPAFFADVAQKTFVFKNAIYALQTLLGDGVVIYRCYVVWQSFWVVVVPIAGWGGVAATGFGGPYSASQATTQAGDVFFSKTGQWITAFYASTFTVNLLSTALLAFRIWKINKNASEVRCRRNALSPVIIIILDAGLLYSATLLAALICFVRHSNGQYIVLDMICPIISIAFYMIIIRVGIAKTTLASRNTSMGSVNPTMGQFAFSPSTHSVASQDYGMRSLQVHITHLTESMNDKDGNITPSSSKLDSEQEV